MPAALYIETRLGTLLRLTAITVVLLFCCLKSRVHNLLVRTFVWNERSSNRLLEYQERMLIELSHNLQTPLAVLKGRVEELERSTLHDGRSTGLVQSIDAVTACINDLLAYARLEHSLKTDIQKVFSLSLLLERLSEELTVIAEDEDIELSLTCIPGIFILGTEGRIHEAVLNLVCNAVKYMGDGPVRRIHITLTEKGGQVLLEITDTGIGIPRHELPRIFERFYRGSNRRYGTVPGTGLGLAIVERIVKEHRGAITVTSDIGKGSTFTLILPRAKQARLRKNRL